MKKFAQLLSKNVNTFESYWLMDAKTKLNGKNALSSEEQQPFCWLGSETHFIDDLKSNQGI